MKDHYWVFYCFISVYELAYKEDQKITIKMSFPITIKKTLILKGSPEYIDEWEVNPANVLVDVGDGDTSIECLQWNCPDGLRSKNSPEDEEYAKRALKQMIDWDSTTNDVPKEVKETARKFVNETNFRFEKRCFTKIDSCT